MHHDQVTGHCSDYPKVDAEADGNPRDVTVERDQTFGKYCAVDMLGWVGRERRPAGEVRTEGPLHQAHSLLSLEPIKPAQRRLTPTPGSERRGAVRPYRDIGLHTAAPDIVSA